MLKLLARVTSAVRTWRDIAAKHGIRGGEIEHMASAFEHAERFIASVETTRSAAAQRVVETGDSSATGVTGEPEVER